MTEVSAKSTFSNAIREPWNWLNLLIPLLGVLAGITRLILGLQTQDGGTALFGLALTVLGLLVGYLYLRYMSSISFELTDEGFRYEADRRKQYFAWKDIEAVKIQSDKKRLTLWMHGKPRAMHYFGVPAGESAQMEQFLRAKAAENGIQQK